MTSIDGKFFFRLAEDCGFTFCEIYERRENKRWYQREFSFVARRIFWNEDRDGTPDEYAARMLDNHLAGIAERQQEQALLQQYKDLKPIS
jgi:hypothetical protein